MLKNKQGFTLIELMVVVMIIGILAGIAIPNYRVTTIKAKIATNMPLLKALQNDIINYYNLTGQIPTKLTQLSINKNEFTLNNDNTEATHSPTNCTISLEDTTISEDCNQSWELLYPVVQDQATGWYKTSTPTFKINGDNDRLQKIARSFGWTPINDNEYQIN